MTYREINLKVYFVLLPLSIELVVEYLGYYMGISKYRLVAA